MNGWPKGLRFRPINPGDWPGQRPARTKVSPFDATLGSTQELLDRELRMVGATSPVIQIELSEGQIRLDGLPRADARPARPGVIISFTHPKVGALRYPCERFRTWQDNVRAIALGLEALRKVERYGITSDHQQYRGWRAIESRTVVAETGDLAEAMQVIQEAANVGPSVWKPGFEATIGVVLRGAQRRTHPDAPGGSAEAFHAVQEAIRTLKAEGLVPS